MNSFELNKILGALLACCLILLGLNITAGAVFAPVKPQKPGFDIAVKEPEAKGAAGPAEPSQPIENLLASASSEKGQATAKQCAACHTFEKGGPNRVGPNLFGVVGRKKASHEGFNYSAAMKAKGGDWSIQELNAFIHNPKAHIPGTNMTFAGISRDNARADVLVYLNSLADSPKALPQAVAAPAGNAPAPSAGASPGSGAPAATPQPGNAGAQGNAPGGRAPPPK
ncbi:MAG: cytochrome c family protein [Pseudolabrys sp.]|nr:cytochrome c family protein [Pseudolabrys sp.]